jgi:hypothetical protein
MSFKSELDMANLGTRLAYSRVYSKTYGYIFAKIEQRPKCLRNWIHLRANITSEPFVLRYDQTTTARE